MLEKQKKQAVRESHHVSKMYINLIQNYLRPMESEASLYHDLVKTYGDENYSFGQQVPLQEMESILERLGSRFGKKPLGLEIGRYAHPSDFGVLGYTLMNSESLLHALKFAGRYKHAMNEGFDVSVCSKSEYCHFQIKNHIESRLAHCLVEMDFACAIQLARFLVGSQKENAVKLIQVNFQHRVSGPAEEYSALFGCPVKFGQDSNEMIISRKVLDLPVRSADPRLLKMYMRKIARMQSSRNSRLLTHQKVFTYVSNHIGQELPSITDAANYFNMSVSTLKSHLREDGFSYTKIVDHVRKDEAVKLVNKSSIQLKEVGTQLGFSNPGAFSRAFRRWTNMSPAEYRRSICTDRSYTP